MPRWLGQREDVAIKLMGLLMSEREREKDQEVRVSVLLLLGIFRINIDVLVNDWKVISSDSSMEKI